MAVSFVISSILFKKPGANSHLRRTLVSTVMSQGWESQACGVSSSYQGLSVFAYLKKKVGGLINRAEHSHKAFPVLFYFRWRNCVLQSFLCFKEKKIWFELISDIFVLNKYINAHTKGHPQGSIKKVRMVNATVQWKPHPFIHVLLAGLKWYEPRNLNYLIFLNWVAWIHWVWHQLNSQELQKWSSWHSTCKTAILGTLIKWHDFQLFTYSYNFGIWI